jgi:ParB family transcriptional regulator, chromosome partitioning protein
MNEEQIQYLTLDQIHRDPDQPRTEFDPESLHGLAEGLKEVGLLVPPRVRLIEGRYVLVDGERRLRAAKLAGLTKIGVIVEGKDLSPEEVTLRQLIANCQREDLNHLDRSNAYHSLMERTGWTASTLAARLGSSSATVSRHLGLRQLPEPIREQVNRGDIPLRAASSLLTVEDKESQADLARRVAAGTLTCDALAGAIKSQRNAEDSSQSGTNRVCCKLPTASVTVSADSLNLENFILALEAVLAQARKARTQGIEVSTLAKMFRDQARAKRSARVPQT